MDSKTQSTPNSLRLSRMYKQYGKEHTRRCGDCVNCQPVKKGESKRMCICYGKDIEWNPNAVACGLFNVPYYGMRPRPRPLVEMYKDSAIPSETSDVNEQIYLF